MVTAERWQKISKREQLGHIASEILRANLVKDNNFFLQILERAIYLVDLSLADKKWQKDCLLLLVLRDELAKAYIGETDNLEKLYAIL